MANARKRTHLRADLSIIWLRFFFLPFGLCEIKVQLDNRTHFAFELNRFSFFFCVICIPFEKYCRVLTEEKELNFI